MTYIQMHTLCVCLGGRVFYCQYFLPWRGRVFYCEHFYFAMALYVIMKRGVLS
jgi:hypothetical protein